MHRICTCIHFTTSLRSTATNQSCFNVLVHSPHVVPLYRPPLGSPQAAKAESSSEEESSDEEEEEEAKPAAKKAAAKAESSEVRGNNLPACPHACLPLLALLFVCLISSWWSALLELPMLVVHFVASGRLTGWCVAFHSCRRSRQRRRRAQMMR